MLAVAVVCGDECERERGVDGVAVETVLALLFFERMLISKKLNKSQMK
jgi:hypothetical protein